MNKAVLHVRPKEYNKVNLLAGKVHTGLTENAAQFPNPDPSMEVLLNENTLLSNLINTKDGSKQINQAILDQSQIVYNKLKLLADFVSRIANGNKSAILASGFDFNDDASSIGIPGKVVIRRVTDGSSVCSAKIFITALTEAKRYKVETSTTPNDSESWKIALDPASSRNIEIDSLPRGAEVFIRVVGGNSHGWGIPSDYVSFIPR